MYIWVCSIHVYGSDCGSLTDKMVVRPGAVTPMHISTFKHVDLHVFTSTGMSQCTFRHFKYTGLSPRASQSRTHESALRVWSVAHTDLMRHSSGTWLGVLLVRKHPVQD